MKTPTTDLYELAQSLTAPERRHFSLRTGKKEAQYVRLLKALLELPSYDEKALRRSVRHLSVAKRHLYFLLLDDLAAGQTSSIEDEVRKGCDHIRILRGKGLNAQAKKLVLRYKKKAYEFELFGPLLDLLGLEKKLLGSQVEEKELEQLYREESQVLENLANTNAYWRLASQIGRLQWQYQKMPGEEQQKALQELFADPLLSGISMAKTLQSKIHFYRAVSTYYFTIGQPEEAYRLNKQFLDLLENSPAFLKQFPEVYLHTFNNFLIDSLQLQQYKAFAQGLDKLSALSDNPFFRSVKNLDAQLFRQRYLLEINWRLTEGEVEKAGALVPEIESGLARYDTKLPKTHKVTFQYLLAYVLWLNGRHDRSLHWIHQLLQEREDVLLEIFQFARVLNLLVHFELGNWEHLSYLLPSTRRYLRQRRALYRTESALFQFLLKAINTPEPAFPALLRAFAREVEALAAVEEEKRFFNYIDLGVWLRGKIQNN